MTLMHLRQTWRFLLLPYLKSDEKLKIIFLLGSILSFIGLFVYVSFKLNYWSNDFYTALQNLNSVAFIHLLKIFSIYASIAIIAFMLQHYCIQALELRWRQWMTTYFIDAWTKNQAYYHLHFHTGNNDNPDQRITGDIAAFTSQTLSLILGMFQQTIMLLTFLSVLWNLSGSLTFSLYGYTISIPGYMCIGAFLYAAIGSWISIKLGKPLIRMDYEQEKVEANFRYSLVRFRENAESIAFYEGETQEAQKFQQRIWHIMQNKYQIIKRMMVINSWTSFYGQINVVLPVLMNAPRFFAKQITFGHVMQTNSAFGQVSHSLAFIIHNYPHLASWKATSLRLIELFTQIQNVSNATQGIDTFILNENESSFQTHHLDIQLPDGKTLLTDINLEFKPGNHTLMTGPSGIGKSTFLKSLAGLWTYGQGDIMMPPKPTSLFLPQKPYMPLGTLRETLLYPLFDPIENSLLDDVLQDVQLSHLIPELHITKDWSRVLSLGEQQRIAFARALLRQPQWLLLDEATSALDEDNERLMYTLIQKKLPSTTVISVGHRSSLKLFHTHEVLLDSYTPDDLLLTHRSVA